jgi:hypothetical protein
MGMALFLMVAGPVYAGAVYSDFVLNQTGPVIYWSQGETAGSTAFDQAAGTGGANHGTYATAASSYNVTLGQAGPRPGDGFGSMVSDNMAPAVEGHGVTRYDSLSSTAGASTSAYSVQVWFNASQPFVDRAISYVFGRGNSTTDAGRRDAVYVGGNYTGITPRKLALAAGSNSCPLPAVRGNRDLWENNWYHLVLVRDDSQPVKAKVYLNGKLEIQSTAAWWNDGSGEYLTVGNRPDYAEFSQAFSLGLQGRYDEVAVWNRPLSDAEAWGLFAAATGQPHYPTVVLSDTPEAYWRLNETSTATTAADLTGHGHSFAYHAHARSGTTPDVGPRPSPFGGFELTNTAPTLDGIPRTTNEQPPTDGFVGIASGVLPGTPGGTNNDYTAELWFRIADGATLSPYGAYLLHRTDVTTAVDNVGDYLSARAFSGGKSALSTYNGDSYHTEFPISGMTGEYVLDDNVWYHVAMVREGNDMTVYLNGEVYLATHTLGIRAATSWSHGDWAFGGRSDMPGQQVFAGNIDEIAIYRGALDPNAIRAHYLAALVPEPSTWALMILGGVTVLGVWLAFRNPGPREVTVSGAASSRFDSPLTSLPRSK